MNSLRYLIIGAAVLLFAGCSEKKETNVSAVIQKNINAMRGIVDCFDKRDFTKLGDYVAEDCFDHYGDGLKGLAAMKAEYEKWVTYSENTRIKIITEMATEEYAIVWIRFEEKMKQDVGDMHTGEVYEKTDIEVARLKDGKVVEHWTFIEPSEMNKIMKVEGQN